MNRRAARQIRLGITEARFAYAFLNRDDARRVRDTLETALAARAYTRTLNSLYRGGAR